MSILNFSPVYAQINSNVPTTIFVDTTYNIEGENKDRLDQTIKAIRDSILKLVKESIDDRIGPNNTDFAKVGFFDEFTETRNDGHSYWNLKPLIVDALDVRVDSLDSTANEMIIPTTLEITCEDFYNPTSESCSYILIIKY
ncbi:MAG: hypothetical protein ACPKPY_05365 [Nitrososphaeraceae archaeon]